MMPSFLLCILLFFHSIFVPAYAVEYWSLTDPKRFPTQPALVYQPSVVSINPLTMTALSLGVSFVERSQLPKSIGDAFNPTALLPGAPFLMKNISVQISSEMPFYQKNQAFGFEANASFFDTDGLLTYKRKQGFFLGPLGNIAGTLIIKGGILGAYDSDIVGFQNTIRYKGWGGGIVGGMAVGIDWYVNQWFGFFVEGSLKGNQILQTIGAYTLPSTYYTVGWTIGVKTTF